MVDHVTYLSPKSFDIWMAEQIIRDTYGDTVSVAEKKKTLLKFGRNTAIGTSYAELWNLPTGETEETHVTTNAITHFSSSSGSDTGSLVIEGHTVSGTGTDAEFTFVIQAVTLAGQTKTALTTPMARVTRAYNDTATNWVGDIHVYEDVAVTAGVPGTATAIHMTVPAGNNQSKKASTTISNLDYWIITSANGSILERNAAYGDIRIEVREVGKVFRERGNFAVNSTGGANAPIVFTPPIIVPKNSDFRLVASADGAGTTIAGWANGYLASVQP